MHYITGNHDELLRKFNGVTVGGLEVKNKLFLDLAGQRTWFFHGDVFDVTMQHSKWLTRLGAVGYDALIVLNRSVNALRMRLDMDRISFSKRIKDQVKQAVAFINNFEQTVCRHCVGPPRRRRRLRAHPPTGHEAFGHIQRIRLSELLEFW